MLEIFYRDLNLKAQKEVLKFYGYKTESEGNLEFTPLCILARDWEKDYKTAGDIFNKLRISRMD